MHCHQVGPAGLPHRVVPLSHGAASHVGFDRGCILLASLTGQLNRCEVTDDRDKHKAYNLYVEFGFQAAENFYRKARY